MRKTVRTLIIIMVILATNAFIPLLADGGAREQGIENAIKYGGPLEYVAVTWALATAVCTFFLLHSGKVKKIQISMPIVALLGLCVFSIFWSKMPIVGFKVSAFLILAYLLICIQFAIFGPEQALKDFGTALGVILIASAIMITFVPSYGISVGLAHAGKWQGAFDHKNGLGNFSGLAFVFFTWRAMSRFSISMAFWALLSLVLILGSESRTALFGTATATMVLLMLKTPVLGDAIVKSRFVVLLAAILFAAGIVSLALGFGMIDFTDLDQTFTGRNHLWAYITFEISQAPWLGHGLNQLFMQAISRDLDYFIQGGVIPSSAHNGYFETAYALGVFGLLLELFVLIEIYRARVSRDWFQLILPYSILFCLTNITESRSVGFNLEFIFLMYLANVAVASHAPLATVNSGLAHTEMSNVGKSYA